MALKPSSKISTHLWYARGGGGIGEFLRLRLPGLAGRPGYPAFARYAERATGINVTSVGPCRASDRAQPRGTPGGESHLKANGVQELRLRDHTVSQSIYLDGNGLELYVDADPGIWRDDPAAVATSVPLET
jgi:hypothetical protein